MDAKALARLRPADSSPGAIEASITRMAEVLTALRAEHAELVTARGRLLLSGSPADIERADGRIRTVALDIERLEAAVAELRAGLPAAYGLVQLQHLEALRAEAEAAAGVFADWWTGTYEGLARQIAAGIELELMAQRARNELWEAARSAARDPNVQAAGGVSLPELTPMPRAFLGATAGGAASRLVCLPAVEPGTPIFWPVGYQRAPIKTGEAAAYA
jgi:hypothetical protein